MNAEQAAVFIDGGFFDKIMEDFAPPKKDTAGRNSEYFRLNYEKFANELCKLCEAKRLRTYYYHCKPIDDGSAFYKSRISFFNGLTRTPRLQFREGKLSKHRLLCRKKGCGENLMCPKCKTEQWDIRQKRTDDLLIVDVVSLSWRGLINKVILVGGDSDFVPSFKEAKEAGVITYVFYCNTKSGSCRIHDELYDIFDERLEL